MMAGSDRSVLLFVGLVIASVFTGLLLTVAVGWVGEKLIDVVTSGVR